MVKIRVIKNPHIKHLRISKGGRDLYICNQAVTPHIEKFVDNEEDVTCERCLNKLKKHPTYAQNIRIKIVPENKFDARRFFGHKPKKESI